MLFNSDKIDILKNTSLDIKIGNWTISKVNNHKYFGITTYSNLNWSNHIETFQTKLLDTVGISYKTQYYVNQNFFVQHYFNSF